jgi:hypothetical protein
MAVIVIGETPKPPITIIAAPYAPSGPMLAATSDSTINPAIGTGDYTFVLNEIGIGFVPGIRLRSSAAADPSGSWIEGTVKSFDGTTVVITADWTSGIQEFYQWNLNVAGQPGPVGPRGDTGAQGPPGTTNIPPNPVLTGTPTCPTAPVADNSQQIANTAHVKLVAATLQPLNSNLSSLGAASALAIYWRSAANTWSPVTIGNNLTFVSGTLSASLTGTAPLDSPIFTGDPQAPTPAKADNDTSVATTAFVKTVVADYAPLASPVLTGTPVAPTPASTDNSTTIATTAYVTGKLVSGYQPLDPDLTSLANFTPSGVMVWRKASGDWQPVLMGTNIGFDATTGTLNAAGGMSGGSGVEEAPADGVTYGRKNFAWVQATVPSDLTAYALIASPTFTGTPLAPTPTPGDSTQKLATTAFVANAVTTGNNSTISLLRGTASTNYDTLGEVETALNSINTSLSTKANTDSPGLTGTPTAPTVTPATDSSTKIATDAFVQAAIAAAISTVSSFTTGDVKLTLKTVADTGWVMMNDGTIGNTASNATYANANAQALFTLIWNNIPQALAPVTGGRGASAAADWGNQKQLALPKTLGRALAAAGNGAGLSSRPLGTILGEETHTDTIGETASHIHDSNTHYHSLPSHIHQYPTNGTLLWGQPNYYVTVDGGSNYNVPQWAGYFGPNADSTAYGGSGTTGGFGISTLANGGGGAHNNMQPSVFLNVMVKL